VDLTKLNMRRADLGRRMRQFHQRFDLLLTPSMPKTAPEAVDTAAGLLSAKDMDKLFGWTPFTYPFNLTQQPAITLPSGLAADGLPMGVQLVANMHEDALLLRCAFALESALPAMPGATLVP
jgi:aspartyl-tRNA(Asn)/glutamyl-tRNA(Gln) amidotransferase subunit A